MKISSLIERLEAWVPPGLAESWDASGLQVGDPDGDTGAVLLCLDVSESTLSEAVENGAKLVLSHHPLLFTPLKSLDVRSGVGRLIHQCITSGLTVYSLHTNLDKIAGGMNDYAMELLGIRETAVLVPSSEEGKFFKLVTFVPEEKRESLLKALFEAGGGKIGAYEGCSFASPGEGTFFAGEETTPVVGEKGTWNRVPEARIEVLFPAGSLERGINALMAAHPYEVPAYDIYPLYTPPVRGSGFGRIGQLEPPSSWEAFLTRIRQALGVEAFRIVGKPVEPVSRVALCTGSGASFIPQAAGKAQVYITGDVKFHEAQEAEALGLTVVDVGHFALERIFGDVMARWFEREGLTGDVKIFKSTRERDPFIYFHKGEDI